VVWSGVEMCNTVFKIMTKYKYMEIDRYMTTEYYLTLSPASGKKKLHY